MSELEKIMQEQLAILPTVPDRFRQLVLACYANDYSQKQEIIIDDEITEASPLELLSYGIRSTKSMYYSNVNTRVFILFVDYAEDISTPEAFDTFSKEYEQKYLPADVTPLFIALKFRIPSWEDFARYLEVARGKYPEIQPFYTVTSLRKEAILHARLQNQLSKIGKQFNPFVLSADYFNDRIMKCISEGNIKEETAIIDFHRQLDEIIEKDLVGKNLIINDCVVDDKLSRYLALALSYISYKKKIPVLVDDLIHDEFLYVYRRFFCNFEVFTAYDKIMYLRQFPKFCYASRSILDFLVYFCPSKRKLLAKIEYLVDGKIFVNDIDLYNINIYPSIEESSFVSDLIELEDKSQQKKFLHIGNCLYMDIDGKKRLVRLVEIVPKFSAVIMACDDAVEPFIKELGLSELTDMVSCNIITFYKGSNGKNLLYNFVQFLQNLSLKGVIDKIDTKSGIVAYRPEHAKSGLGMLVYEFTHMRSDQFRYSGIDSLIMNLYGFYNVKMRNELVDRITDIIPLHNLRHRTKYLTQWGANPTLAVSGDLFKTTYYGK